MPLTGGLVRSTLKKAAIVKLRDLMKTSNRQPSELHHLQQITQAPRGLCFLSIVESIYWKWWTVHLSLFVSVMYDEVDKVVVQKRRSFCHFLATVLPFSRHTLADWRSLHTCSELPRRSISVFFKPIEIIVSVHTSSECWWSEKVTVIWKVTHFGFF